MEKIIEFNNAWSLVNKSDEYKKKCVEQDFDELEQKYIVACAMDSSLNDRQLCELIGTAYNLTDHKHIKANRDDDRHDELIFIIARCLQGNTQHPDGRKLSDIERLDAMIIGSKNETIQLKAMELRQKLVDKASGSSTLKPWERLWCDVIIPNMVLPQ